MMKLSLRSRTAALTAGVLASTCLVVTTTTSDAQAAQGNRPLASVLAADGSGFDRNPRDFDVVEAAVLAVLAEKPNSPLAAIAKGKQRLTVFLPTDGAFRRLVRDLIGKRPKREQAVLKRVAAAAGDIDTLEAILLYHVVAGRTLNSPKVVAAADKDAALTTAAGAPVGVRADANGRIRLADADPDDLDPRVVPAALDINRGNKQVAHGINRVLRPADL